MAEPTFIGTILAEVGRVEDATYRLLVKFHRETDCGTLNGDDHWTECNRVVDAFGYDSWEHWQAHHEAAVTGDTERLELVLSQQGEQLRA